MDKLTAIKARLGSIAPSRMNEFPKSVQRLLEEDMPALISFVEEHIKTTEAYLEKKLLGFEAKDLGVTNFNLSSGDHPTCETR